MKPEDLMNEIELEDSGVWMSLEVKPGRVIRARMLARSADAVVRAQRTATARFRLDLEPRIESKETRDRQSRAQVCVYLRMLRAATLEIEDFDLAANADDIFRDPPADPEETDEALRRWGKLRTALHSSWERWDSEAAAVLADSGKGQPTP